jgi:hypothetical protein
MYLDPNLAAESSNKQWDQFLRAARREGLLGRFAMILDSKGITQDLPTKIQDTLTAGKATSLQHRRMILWEVDRIGYALRHCDFPVVLLKGAAYLTADLPVSLGRLVSDIDILVARVKLRAVEAALLAEGWQHVKPDPYDQRYYRRWMHELPPMRHQMRRTEVDVHHNILPMTGKLQVDAEALLEAAVRVEDSRFFVLSPTDMTLHSAVHLFHDGAFEHGLRDLLDLDALMSDFARDPKFWDALVNRAERLGLTRPMYYAIDTCKRMLGTDIPASVVEKASAWRPGPTRCAAMEYLVRRQILRSRIDDTGRENSFADIIALTRAHLLRMPLRLLIPHLARKARMRLADRRLTETA